MEDSGGGWSPDETDAPEDFEQSEEEQCEEEEQEDGLVTLDEEEKKHNRALAAEKEDGFLQDANEVRKALPCQGQPSTSAA